jgi:hypothetical protein
MPSVIGSGKPDPMVIQAARGLKADFDIQIRHWRGFHTILGL